MAPTSIGVELASAIRAVNAKYRAILEERRPEALFGDLVSLLRRAEQAPDRAAARRIIERLRDVWLTTLGEVDS